MDGALQSRQMTQLHNNFWAMKCFTSGVRDVDGLQMLMQACTRSTRCPCIDAEVLQAMVDKDAMPVTATAEASELSRRARLAQP